MIENSQEVLDPQRPIIDAHHHLWDQLSAPPSDTPFARHSFSDILKRIPRYLLDEFLVDLNSGHDVRATVFVECGSMYRAQGDPAFRSVGETEFAGGIAAMTASGIYGPVQACAGIVGHVDLHLANQAQSVLEAHIDAGNGRFRGIRQSGAFDADTDILGPLSGFAPPEGLYRDSSFRRGFAALDPLGLCFDAWLLEPQIPDLTDLAQAFPDTTIVFNHAGSPLGIGRYAGRRDERFDRWRDNVREVADCDNVVVKLGGLAAPFSGFGWSYEQPPDSYKALAQAWAPYIHTCIDAFGPERCMFESNFPPDSFSCSYSMLWNAFKYLARDYSEDEKTALFSGTAARTYSLDITS